MKVLVVLISLLSVIKSQKNISPNGTATQSSTYYWIAEDIYLTADLAITGGPQHDFYSQSCAVTGYSPRQYVAWWMLTFPVDTIYITNVKIYYRGNTLENFAGYSLYISNSSTTKTDGYLCNQHIGPNVPSKLENVSCNHLGRNVIIYNERDETGNNIPSGYSSFAMLELCDVQVYGCYKGWWGGDCSKPCPVNCIDGHCYPGNGSCVWGCNPDNCINGLCIDATGVCSDGCKVGLRGESCDKPCTAGTFGDKCAETCHCVNHPCDPVTGACPPGGCRSGYTCTSIDKSTGQLIKFIDGLDLVKVQRKYKYIKQILITN